MKQSGYFKSKIDTPEVSDEFLLKEYGTWLLSFASHKKVTFSLDVK